MDNKQIIPEDTEIKKTNSISVCDLLKNNTTKIIRKWETQTPIYAQLYSDYYNEYLHSLEDIFGTCYLSEKHFFDNLGVDEKTLNTIDQFWNGFTEGVISYIDMYTNCKKAHVDTMVSFMKSYDHFVHVGIDYYAQMFSQFETQLRR